MSLKLKKWTGFKWLLFGGVCCWSDRRSWFEPTWVLESWNGWISCGKKWRLTRGDRVCHLDMSCPTVTIDWLINGVNFWLNSVTQVTTQMVVCCWPRRSDNWLRLETAKPLASSSAREPSPKPTQLVQSSFRTPVNHGVGSSPPRAWSRASLTVATILFLLPSLKEPSFSLSDVPFFRVTCSGKTDSL